MMESRSDNRDLHGHWRYKEKSFCHVTQGMGRLWGMGANLIVLSNARGDTDHAELRPLEAFGQQNENGNTTIIKLTFSERGGDEFSAFNLTKKNPKRFGVGRPGGSSAPQSGKQTCRGGRPRKRGDRGGGCMRPSSAGIWGEGTHRERAGHGGQER